MAAVLAVDSQGKYWCFTIHSPYPVVVPNTLDEYKTQRGTVEVTYTVGQEEKCPETGALHLQGYIEFDKEVRFSWLKKTFDARIHWERRHGTAQQAADYCKKADSATGEFKWELGEISRSEQGKRTDLHEVAEIVLAGATLKRVAQEHPVAIIKYARGIQTLVDLVMAPPGDTPKRVIILYGEPGSGKSSWVREYLDASEATFYKPAKNNAGALSFETYTDQEWIWLDDFESGALTAQALKCLCDRYPEQLPGRGSSRWALHRGVLITSNYPIESWYKEPVEAVALKRRAEQIWNCHVAKWIYMGGTMLMPAERPNPMAKYL